MWKLPFLRSYWCLLFFSTANKRCLSEFDFNPTWRVLSGHETPLQALTMLSRSQTKKTSKVKVIGLECFSLQAWISWKLKPSTPTSLLHRPQAPPCQICTSPPATSRVPDKSSLNSPLTMIGGAAMFASIAKNLSSSSWTGGGTSWWKSCWCWCCPQPARSWRWRWSYWSTIIQSCEGYIGDTYWWFIPYKLNIFRN